MPFALSDLTRTCRWLLLLLSFPAPAQDAALPGTTLLTAPGDLSTQMVAGIDRFLMRELERSVGERAKLWHRDFSSPQAYEQSVQPNRDRFRKSIGAVDPRLAVTSLDLVSQTDSPALVAA